MGSFLCPVIFGIICIVIGIFNSKGNISSLHWYHRRRVSEEDVLPFGKKVGLGMIIIGISMIVFGCFSLAADLLENDFIILIGAVILIIGVIIGLAISLSAIIKYNKGLF